ncbi:MAG: hypothetical protein QX196_07020, partial [Methylococcaceae bacterium]
RLSVFEKRGKLEDDELELEFRRICSGSNYHRHPYLFELIFADKRSNSSGLQFADLATHFRREKQKCLTVNRVNLGMSMK